MGDNSWEIKLQYHAKAPRKNLRCKENKKKLAAFETFAALRENKSRKDYIILIAFAKVVTTKGRESQNHGLRVGITSMMMITTVEIKKYNHHLPELSVVFI